MVWDLMQHNNINFSSVEVWLHQEKKNILMLTSYFKIVVKSLCIYPSHFKFMLELASLFLKIPVVYNLSWNICCLVFMASVTVWLSIKVTKTTRSMNLIEIRNENRWSFSAPISRKVLNSILLFNGTLFTFFFLPWVL